MSEAVTGSCNRVSVCRRRGVVLCTGFRGQEKRVSKKTTERGYFLVLVFSFI